MCKRQGNKKELGDNYSKDIMAITQHLSKRMIKTLSCWVTQWSMAVRLSAWNYEHYMISTPLKIVFNTWHASKTSWHTITNDYLSKIGKV